MKRELGIARCGLACCLCSENVICNGCDSGECPDKEGCENKNVQLIKRLNIVMSATENAQKDY